MRRATAVLLGLLLVLGSTSSGMGHVHAAPASEGTAGLHVDHVHLDSDHRAHDAHHAHHAEPAPGRELAIDHDGSDAVTLGWAASRTMPKRDLPCLAAAPLYRAAAHAPANRRLDRIEDPPGDPPLRAGPPGRAPPV